MQRRFVHFDLKRPSRHLKQRRYDQPVRISIRDYSAK